MMKPLLRPVWIAVCCASATAAEFDLGEHRLTTEGLAHPTAVAVRGGAIAVAETDADRISIIHPEGGAPRRIGETGTADGAFTAPMGVTFTPDGGLLVSDTGNHRIQRFGADGAWQWSAGKKGTGPGEFAGPRGIAVRGDTIAVADTGNHRIVILDADGTFRFAIGGYGEEEGRLNRPRGVAIDDSGAIFVADSGNDRVQRFAADGTFELAFGEWGPFPGLMDEPVAVATNAGRVFVVDRRNHRISVYTSDGVALESWGRHAWDLHEGDGALHYPDGFAIDDEGGFAVVCESFEDRCQLIHPRPAGSEAPVAPPFMNDPRVHFGTRIDSDGLLLALAEPERHRAYVFETSRAIPVVIGDFGERGEGAGLLKRSRGIALDAARPSLFVGDPDKRRLQRFDIEWTPEDLRRYDPRRVRFGKSWDLAGLTRDVTPGLDWVIEPASLRTCPGGGLAIVDPANAVLIVLNDSFTRASVIGAGILRHPVDAVMTAGGGWLVADAHAGAIFEFDREGSLVRTISDGLQRPAGVTVGPDGTIYVSDRAQCAIREYSADGTSGISIGGRGVEHGLLWKPAGVIVDRIGRIVVVDHGNHRCQAFTTDGEWALTFGTGRAFTPNDQPRGVPRTGGDS